MRNESQLRAALAHCRNKMYAAMEGDRQEEADGYADYICVLEWALGDADPDFDSMVLPAPGNVVPIDMRVN